MRGCIAVGAGLLVPGFGEVNAGALVPWARRVEPVTNKTPITKQDVRIFDRIGFKKIS